MRASRDGGGASLRGLRGAPAAALACAALLAGCALQPRSGLRGLVSGIAVSGPELRLQARTLAPTMLHLVESSADNAAAMTRNPDERLLLLRFKAEAVPAMYAALFNSDPLAGLADAWSLIAQMRGYFEGGAGAVLPPGPRGVLLGGCAVMEGEMMRLDRLIRPRSNPEKARAHFRKWAAAHPVTDFSTRESGVKEYVALMAEEGDDPLTLLGGVSEDISDINVRIDMLNAALPKQVGWQLDLLVAELIAGKPPFDAAGVPLRRIGAAAALAALAAVWAGIRIARARGRRGA